MYKRNKVSLIFPARNEEENIYKAVKDFKKINVFDEIIVVDNNSSDHTSTLAKKAGARVIKESKTGYGFALQAGMRAARGDYIILCEPDSTFLAKDSLKLLNKIAKYDLVLGTRTNKKFIRKRANMRFLLRTGNIVLAKLMQFLFNTEDLTDCGCTYRAIRKDLLIKIGFKFSVGGSYFLPEMLILSKYAGARIIEVPVNYRKRVGQSKITGSIPKSIKVGLNMFRLIIGYRLIY